MPVGQDYNPTREQAPRPGKGSRVGTAAKVIASVAAATAFLGAVQYSKPDWFAPTPLKSELTGNPWCKDVARPGILTMVKRDAAVLFRRDEQFAEPKDVSYCPTFVKENTVNAFADKEEAAAKAAAEKEAKATVAAAAASARASAMKAGASKANLTLTK